MNISLISVFLFTDKNLCLTVVDVSLFYPSTFLVLSSKRSTKFSNCLAKSPTFTYLLHHVSLKYTFLLNEGCNLISEC